MKAFWIFVAVVVVIAAFAIYFLWWKPSQAGAATSTGSGGSSTAAPPATQGLPPKAGAHSVKIAAAEVMPAQDPGIYFSDVQESQLATYNLLGAPGSNPGFIHIEQSFSAACSKYIWYRGWLYVSTSSATDAQGIKTCYYKLATAELPSEIRVYIPGSQQTCINFRLYLSGREYLYVSTQSEQGIPPRKFCTYKKQ